MKEKRELDMEKAKQAEEAKRREVLCIVHCNQLLYSDLSNHVHSSKFKTSLSLSLGPFHGAIAVPSVTRCRCRRRRGHQCAGGMRRDSSDTW